MELKPRIIRITLIPYPRYICSEVLGFRKFYLPEDWDKFKAFYKQWADYGYGIIEIGRIAGYRDVENFDVCIGPLDSDEAPRDYVTKLSDYAPITPQPGYQEVVQEIFIDRPYLTLHKVQGMRFKSVSNII